jgi:hypothetical protein
MKNKVLKYSLGALLIFSFIYCKKVKLRKEYAVLEGSWHWYRGWGDGGAHELELDLKERGRFKLFRGKKKIEYGRLVKKDGYVKFVSENLIYNKQLMLDQKMIVFMSNDSINITRTDCADCAFSTFRKD